MAYLEYTDVTDPVFSAEDDSTIDCTVTFTHIGAPVRFTAALVSPEYQHSEEIYARAIAVEFGPVAPYVVHEPTPEEIRDAMPRISPRELQLTLLNHGISPDQVLAAIMSMPAGIDRDRARIEWEKATYFKRNHDLIDTLGAVFGFTPEQIDAMWEEAQTI